ncbi:MAG: hypothetical protein HOP08_14460 [Cyclobacteriaceae bacterium]|nr:hypothetical protein [Cyclobacteriaceae bacterium]
MSQLIETIRVQKGEFYHLSYHEQRMQRVWKGLFNISPPWSLQEVLSKTSVPLNGLYKCRLTYDTKVKDVAFEPYEPRRVGSLKMIYNDTISYDHKFKDRTVLNELFSQRGDKDDVLIIKNKLVTDTSYANILFRKGSEWFTPSSCLLQGTTRQRLIDEKKIKVEEISVDMITSFESFRIINSMLLDEAPEITVGHIIN